jgi:hypothetical protein
MKPWQLAALLLCLVPACAPGPESGAPEPSSVTPAPGSEANPASAADAAGRAAFEAAERVRATADQAAPPVYRGSGKRDEVLTFVSAVYAPWFTARQAALEDVEKAYAKVLEVKPDPSPRWAVASGERVGSLWSGLADDFRSMPVPEEWQGNGVVPGTHGTTYDDLRREYLDKLSLAGGPLLERARTAYQRCSETARRSHVADEHARACDAWLAAHPKP